ncbi:hypothetical protein G9C98_003117 [Cotesia typhae]|uniref:Uncharacterized protein n=1 Tax=Cotesia typhae TaxID=2053667 RepID=A0A8J5RD13_9HYME|nr:hypothetical protein G9C98_003117 [Cotesia typhae]
MLNTVCFITAFKMHLQNSTRYLNWQMILRLLLMITVNKKLEQAVGSLSKNFLKIIGLIHHSSKVSSGDVWVLFIWCTLKIIVGNIPVCIQVPSVGGLQVSSLGK